MLNESGRYYYFDNLRAILVFLVILGHMIEPVMNSAPAIRTMYLVVYSFHVPALVFVSGFLAKSHAREEKKSEAIRRFLVPFLFAQAILMMISRYSTGYVADLSSIFMPLHAMWYLLSLFQWYVMLPYFLRLRHPVAVSILLALAMGYSQIIGHVFSLSRTFVFLPFFLAGYFFRIQDLERLRTPFLRAVSLALFLVVAAISYKYGARMEYRWIFGLNSYAALGHGEWYAFLYRLMVMVLFLVMAMSFMILAPQRKNILTNTGSRSIYPYVLHVFLYVLLFNTRLMDRQLHTHEFLAIIAIAAACYMVFSSRFVARLARPLIEPRLKFLLK